MKLKIDTRQKFWMVVLITGGCIFLLVLFVFAPLSKKIKDHKDSIVELTDDLSKSEELLKKNIEGQTFLKFAKRNNISSVINQITQAGVKNQIKFVSIEPLDVETSEKFLRDVLPIKMELTAEYKDVGLFLEMLLKEVENVFVVQEFKIERDETVLPHVRVKLLLDVYLENER